mmetsp:Transcript_2091/g.2364  ORF Transcript_2091/g.2364 Transcript_2091/m.2364 type:complete len:84 (-) Transcript_2091:505-756(-)
MEMNVLNDDNNMVKLIKSILGLEISSKLMTISKIIRFFIQWTAINHVLEEVMDIQKGRAKVIMLRLQAENRIQRNIKKPILIL